MKRNRNESEEIEEIKTILAYSWAARYWLTVGQGLLSL